MVEEERILPSVESGLVWDYHLGCFGSTIRAADAAAAAAAGIFCDIIHKEVAATHQPAQSSRGSLHDIGKTC